jgi:large subunit ribosomal protein L13e
MVRHNNIVPNVHQRKHWQKWVKTFFTQPAKKRRRLEARKAKAARLFPRPVESLRPAVRGQTVRYNRKVKVGRGFTLQEIKEAKLGVDFARSIGISVDHRRRNRTQESLDVNKRRLEAYVNKLVLYPRSAASKDAKAKKNFVADSTKEVLEKFGKHQNTAAVVLGLPALRRREKAIKIEKSLKEEKTYKRQQLEKDNAKRFGYRQEKARKAAAAKEK